MFRFLIVVSLVFTLGAADMTFCDTITNNVMQKSQEYTLKREVSEKLKRKINFDQITKILLGDKEIAINIENIVLDIRQKIDKVEFEVIEPSKDPFIYLSTKAWSVNLCDKSGRELRFIYLFPSNIIRYDVDNKYIDITINESTRKAFKEYIAY